MAANPVRRGGSSAAERRADAARDTGVRRLVFSSTAAVYGIPDATPPAIARSKRMEVSRFFTLEFLSRLLIPLSALAVNIH